jgi:hypothetical protein
MYALRIGCITGIISFLVGVVAEVAMGSLPLVVAFLLLAIIVVVGVVGDMVGVAATSAHEEPLHAQAAHRVKGARTAIELVRKREVVASICNDVIGDISGVLSGAIGAAILYRVATIWPPAKATLMAPAAAALIAALITGGKAYGKRVALVRSTDIMITVARAQELFARKKRKPIKARVQQRKGRDQQ